MNRDILDKTCLGMLHLSEQYVFPPGCLIPLRAHTWPYHVLVEETQNCRFNIIILHHTYVGAPGTGAHLPHAQQPENL